MPANCQPTDKHTPPPSGTFQLPTAPAAAGRLILRDADVELADGRRRSQQMPVRRAELREHFELREPRHDVGIEHRAQCFRVEQIETDAASDNPTPAPPRP